ncbi:MAG TPA: TonB-dependent receptor [Sphingomicrobium sp.]
MLGRAAFVMASAVLALGAPAAATTRPQLVDIRPQPLSSALKRLARQTGIELLYSQDLVRNKQAGGATGRLTGAEALRRLVSGTGLTVRRAASGAWIIEPEAPAPLEQQDADVPEILVIGRRTQNSDIRRLEDDVQPYRVITTERLTQAHRDNVDQYFSSRVTANTNAIPPSLMENGETLSQIDLRGLGSDLTLILLDGRRLPQVPQSVFGMRQSDINAIPLQAIERIEVLTGTSGGIHGFGALGGTVNVVLKRDYRGFELHATGGTDSRGDGGRLALAGRLGFTPNDGRTDVMLSFGLARSNPLSTGDRDFRQSDRERTASLVTEAYVNNLPTADSVGVFSFLGDELVFKPQYGGQPLGAGYTYLPKGFSGDPAQLAASLAARAGQLDFSLSEGEAENGLGSNPRTAALIANVRHRLGPNLEAFVDAIFLRNRGRHVEHLSHGELFLDPGSPLNPFEQFLILTYPVPGRTSTKTVTFDSRRFAAGLVATLPLGWRGNAEATVGSVRAREKSSNEGIFLSPLFGDPSNPQFNPLGNWQAFQQSLGQYLTDSFFGFDQRNKYDEQSLRLAGPIFRTAAGPAMLTLLAQRRREHVPRSGGFLTSNVEGSPVTSLYDFARRSTATRSLHAEMRIPLLSKESDVPLLSGLELQLAVRRDNQQLRFSRDPAQPDTSERLSPRFAETSYTAGAKAFPLPWLMVRGSYATGRIPPPPPTLIDVQEMDSFSITTDPRRGDRFLFLDGPHLAKTQGSPNLKTIKASTLSVGLVARPFGEDGLRVAVDFSRIRKRGDVLFLSESIVLANEDFWPERVTREPLSDADRALGYTGGRITMIDSRAMNGAGLRVDSIDASFEWPTRLLDGQLRVYGLATRQVRNVKWGLFADDIERVGRREAPLKWRANGGFDWTRGRTSFGANLQYFSKYRIYEPGLPEFLEEQIAEFQGGIFVESQVYLDLYATRRFELSGSGPVREGQVDLGIVNLLDKKPPRESNFAFLGPGYSRYGDPRLRRVELTLSLAY